MDENLMIKEKCKKMYLLMVGEEVFGCKKQDNKNADVLLLKNHHHDCYYAIILYVNDIYNAIRESIEDFKSH